MGCSSEISFTIARCNGTNERRARAQARGDDSEREGSGGGASCIPASRHGSGDDSYEKDDDGDWRRDGDIELNRHADGGGAEARRSDADRARLTVGMTGEIGRMRDREGFGHQQEGDEQRADPRLQRGTPTLTQWIRAAHE